MVSDDIPARLRYALQHRLITKRALAELAGLHHNTLLGCEAEGWNPKLSTLRALEPHLPGERAA